MIFVLNPGNGKKICLLFCGFYCLTVLCSFNLFGEKKLSVQQYSNVKSITAGGFSQLEAPKEYISGGFVDNGDLIALGGWDGTLNPSFHLTKYIVINRKSDVVKKMDKVLLWNRYGVLLKINLLKDIVYINANTNEKKLVNIDTKMLKCLCFNPSTQKIVYMLRSASVIYQYDIVKYRNRAVARLDRDNIFGLYQLTDNIILYIRPQITQRFSAMGMPSENIHIKIPLYLTNLKTYEESQVALISGNGILFHFNENTGEAVFVVEENGYFKLISNKFPRYPRKIYLSSLNKYTVKGFHGLVLNYSSMHPDGKIIAISRLKLRRIKKYESNSFEFFNADSDNYSVEESEIYLIDIKGNYIQLTNTPDQIEMVCDWSPKGDEILYFDHKNKKFCILKLESLM